MRTTLYTNNCLFISSHFIKKIKFHGNVGTYKIWGSSPWHNGLGFFCWGRSFKIHMKIKRELFMFVKKFEACNFFLTIKFGNVGSWFGVKAFY
jgi:hypothetical protein